MLRLKTPDGRPVIETFGLVDAGGPTLRRAMRWRDRRRRTGAVLQRAVDYVLGRRRLA